MLDGKVLVITGAGRGIGREIALFCARQGASVVVADPGIELDGSHVSSNPARETVDAIRGSGGKAFANYASVADRAGAVSMVEDAISQFGRIDAIINAAGILRDAWWHKMTRAQWDDVVNVHLNGAYNICRAATPHFHMQEQGSFLHFTSGAALHGNAGQANYSAAKAGVVGLSQGIALDMERFNVRSNCIAPLAWSRMIEDTVSQTDADEDMIAQLRSLGADKIAPLAAFLVSDAAKSITGQVFGAHGDEIVLYDKPRPIATLHREGGWTLDSLADELIPAFEERQEADVGFEPVDAVGQVFPLEVQEMPSEPQRMVSDILSKKPRKG